MLPEIITEEIRGLMNHHIDHELREQDIALWIALSILRLFSPRSWPFPRPVVAVVHVPALPEGLHAHLYVDITAKSTVCG